MTAVQVVEEVGAHGRQQDLQLRSGAGAQQQALQVRMAPVAPSQLGACT